MSFKDHFSRQSAAYSRYRPGYPPELVAWVAAQAPGARRAFGLALGAGASEVGMRATLLAERLQVDPGLVIPAHEDVHYYLWKEHRLPANVV